MEEYMKVKMQFGNAPISGKAGELVYCYNKRTGKMYAKQYAYPTITDNNRKMGNVAKNLFALQPSEDYKYDCRTYAFSYSTSDRNRGINIWNWSNCYLHLMYAMAKKMPELDLSTLTKAEIYSLDLPCISVKRAVEAGLLAVVQDYGRLDKLF